MIQRLFASSLVRFGLVAVAGLCVDLGTAWALRSLTTIPLTLAAFLGFVAGAIFNYLLHERWTFGTKPLRPSAAHSICWPCWSRWRPVSARSRYWSPPACPTWAC